MPGRGQTDADLAREHTARFRAAISGTPVVEASREMGGAGIGTLAIQPQSPGLRDRIWWGAGTRATAVWTAEQGMNLMSSTLLTEDTGVPFDRLQAEQIALFRDAWERAGWERDPARLGQPQRAADRLRPRPGATSAARPAAATPVGYLDGGLARFGKTYAGEPDAIADELAEDAAVRGADTLLLTVPTSSASSTTRDLLRDDRRAGRAGDRVGAETAGRGLTSVGTGRPSSPRIR